jgi:sulfate adenylyltransferase subunit 2
MWLAPVSLTHADQEENMTIDATLEPTDLIGLGDPADDQRSSADADRRLAELEAHAIFVIREVAAECERPVLLFSGGKDSVVMLHLAQRAFAPGRIPFPVMHIDTGHNFPEVIDFRDALVAALDVQLVVASVQDAIDEGRVADPGPTGSRNRLQTEPLLYEIARHKFDAAFGGARRDEDKARAKERVLSFRDSFGQWDPKNQRPELWRLYNARVRAGEHLRAFPLSDWTELDIWRYIAVNNIDLPQMYYSHRRTVVARDGMLLATGPFTPPAPGEVEFEETVRYRTVGDMTCTGAVRSPASDAWEVLAEIEQSRITERGATRADDRFSEAAMEDRKREGYF